MKVTSYILRADTTTRLKLRRWKKKGVLLLQPNALAMRWGKIASPRAHVAAPRSRPAPAAIILMYHRVTAAPSDPQLLCVTPQHFAEHLEVLSERYRVVPLRELAARAHAERSVRGLAAITFDDGYADN